MKIGGTGLVKGFLFAEQNRNTWVKEQLEKIPDGASILDAGAGTQRYKPYCQHLQYTSQDFCQYQGGGEEGLQFDAWDTSAIDLVSDIADIPVDDETFDAVLCTEVLEHVKNPDRVLLELSRVLKQGGKLIITAPFCSFTHMAPYHFCTGFNIFWYQEWMREFGLDIEIIERNGNYFDFLLQEIARIRDVTTKYSNEKITLFEQILSYLMIRFLHRLSKTANRSSELLCFGYHVVATKRCACNKSNDENEKA